MVYIIIFKKNGPYSNIDRSSAGNSLHLGEIECLMMKKEDEERNRFREQEKNLIGGTNWFSKSPVYLVLLDLEYITRAFG